MGNLGKRMGKAESGPPSSSSIGRVIVRGASWSLLAQMTPLAVNIVMTPYVIAGFGVRRYGLFLIANSLVAFLSSFDGGIGSSVARWTAVYAARDDRAAAMRLVRSMLLVTSLIGALLFATLYFGAGPALGFFRVSGGLRDEAVTLFRCLSIVLALTQVRGLFAAQLQARQMFGWISFMQMTSYIVYAVGLVYSVENGLGLRGVGYTYLAQALMVTVFTVPRAMAFLDRHSGGLMARSELKTFLRFAANVQVTGFTTMVTSLADTFVVGRFLSVSSVAVYGAGANFALQLRVVTNNVLGPMSTALAHAYGRGGLSEATTVFTRLQRRWVQGTTGWCAVGVGAAYFGVSSWLGPDFREAGLVASLLIATSVLSVWPAVLILLLTAAGRPSMETRSAALALTLNAALTIPLVVKFGIIGTVAATAAGTAVGSGTLLWLTRKWFDPEIRSFFADVPCVPAIVTMAGVFGLEAALHPAIPQGAVGLLLCGAVAAPGLGIFCVLLVGPRKASHWLRTFYTKRRGGRSTGDQGMIEGS